MDKTLDVFNLWIFNFVWKQQTWEIKLSSSNSQVDKVTRNPYDFTIFLNEDAITDFEWHTSQPEGSNYNFDLL